MNNIKKKLLEEQEKQLGEQEKRKLIKQDAKEVHLLLAKSRGFVKSREKLIKPKEPVVFLKRNWGDVEVYEDIKGSTFIIPQPPGVKKQVVEIGQSKHLIRGQRVAYLDNTSLRTMKWGGETLKCYFIDEEDAMPWGSSIKVWSETLEMTISAILINYRNMLGRQVNQNKWLVDIVKYGGLIFLGYLLVKWLFLEPETAAQTAQAVVTNFTDGGIAT